MKSMNNGLIVFGAITVTLLLLSSAIAVPQAHGATAMKTVKKIEENEIVLDRQKAVLHHFKSVFEKKLKNLMDTEQFESLIARIDKVINSEKFKNIDLKEKVLAEQKFGKKSFEKLDLNEVIERVENTLLDTNIRRISKEKVNETFSLLSADFADFIELAAQIIWALICSVGWFPPIYIGGLLFPGTLLGVLVIILILGMPPQGPTPPNIELILLYVLAVVTWPLSLWLIGYVYLSFLSDWIGGYTAVKDAIISHSGGERQ